MKNINYKKIAGFLVSLIILFVPVVILYANVPEASHTTILNPLGTGNDSVEAVLLKIMNIVTIVGTIVVVFFIIYSGFMIVTASGDSGKLTKGKEMFFATIIGGAILLGADLIANIVVNTVKTTTGITSG